MKRLRRIYFRIYRLFMGHLPVGTLVRYLPPIGPEGFTWKTPDGPEYDAVGLVVGGWQKYKHPMPGILIKGSIVLFSGKSYDMEDWDLEVML